ncbi:MAG TPA: AAA family ATPase [Thermoplasmata archaeon]|nr:AAA family ATPase [Thermoplasmata archaeon]
MPEGRRRLAAIMFTDMVAFSALTQKDEPLALKLVDEQRKLVRPVFGRFAGREVKTMGDGALVEFDSALDATECAVEIQRQLFERNRDVSGQRIEIRIGIHVGDVVDSGNDVYGDTVNIASRIEPLAKAGGICVTGPVYEQVQNKIPYPFKALEHPRLKNIESPISVYRLDLPWTPPSLSEVTPFTDRKEELDRLVRAGAAVTTGGGTALAITGEAGVGKSRLVQEFLTRAQHDGTRVLQGRADRGGLSAPFAPWSEALRGFAREASNPLLYQACTDCATEVARLDPELRSRLGRAAESAPGEEPNELRLFEGILRFLDNLSRDAPLVVFLDDVQWSDSASLHLLEFVARRVEKRRILLLVSYRDEPTPELATLESILSGLAREHRIETVSVQRFDSPTSVQFLHRMLQGRSPASRGDLAERLFEKSGGNPMVLEAIVRSLVGEGSLVWAGEGWSPKAGVDIRLPPGIESLARLRLAQLKPRAVDVLRQASVLGAQFTFDALQRVTAIPPDELLSNLEEAVRARLLEERAVGPGRATYGFTDRTVPETLYDEIGLVRRARYHSTVARVFETMSSEGGSIPSAELAYHFLRANEYEKALEYTLLAAQESVRLFAREEALRQYATAQELLESRPDEKRRAEILFNVGDQLNLLGRYTEAFRTMEQAADIYERLGMTKEAGGVHTGIARRILWLNEPVRALEHLEKARRLLETGEPSLELARMYDVLGSVLFEQVRVPEAADNWLRAIEVAGKVGALRVDASARRMLATTVPPGENAKVWEYLDMALANATKADARPVVSDVMVVKAIALLQIRGDGRAALRTVEDAIEYARRGHDVMVEVFTKGNLVTYIQWRLGDLPAAEQVALEHRTFVAGDPRRDRPTAIAVLAEVALARGEVDRAEKLLWEAERLLAEGGDWSESSQTQIVLARCALARHKPLSAVEHLRQSYRLCRKAGPPAIDTLFLLETLSLLVRAHLDGGEPEDAARSLEELAELSRRFGEDLGHAFRLRAEGWVREDRGDALGAIPALEESADLWRRLGWQYEWAQTVLSLASACRASGNSKRAASLEDQVSEYLSKVGAGPGPLVQTH